MAGGITNKLHKMTDAMGGTAGKMNASTITDADSFVEHAAIGDRYEIDAARLALRRSKREDVQQIARKMIADHATSTHHLNAALEMRETAGVTAPPNELGTRHRTMLDHLTSASDDSFDNTYLDQQALAHEETISLMHHYGHNGDNPQLRSFALGTLPVVERHLARVSLVRDTL